MAEETETRMEALKKVYAEIILNTSKEAASRVMVADRKARCFEQQLISLKEDSLSMLLRLKDHFNSVIIEAEARSFKQQMKIEELEAQLCEAEGIIIDLRDELKQVHEQLDTIRHNQEKPLNEHILVTDEIIQECVPQDNAPNSSFISQISDAKSVLVDYEKKVASLHLASQNQFSNTINSTDLSVKSCLKQFHASYNDISSIIMQNRETDLCRNGCTQRIRAFEGSLPNVRLPMSRSGDQNLFIQPTSNAEETARCRPCASDNVFSEEILCSSMSVKSNAKNIPSGELVHRSSSYKNQAKRSSGRSTRKNARYREAIASLQSSRKKFGRTRLHPLCTPLKGCSSSVNEQVIEVPIEIIEMDPKKIKDFPVAESNHLSCNREKAVCTGGGNVPHTKEAISHKFHTAPDDALLDSVLVDVPISEGFSSSRPLSGDRFLKFTFERKRRKNVLGKINENILLNGNPIKKKSEDPTDVVVVENDILKDGMRGDSEEMKQKLLIS